ncbi:putative Protein kinase domain containing protein [Blattamonas nauphoetae]|uniref:mitogen-activated protein kinase kinase n=1 Tax=Blattamonas nauphoetae TaxID=2049346 RepID=A0ABQ9YK59_9EUKA|nr:putative Protein kinase domain containing protein [Blattamonas nauphoetae]
MHEISKHSQYSPTVHPIFPHPYVCESILGSGRTGIVYRARNSESDANVAIKVIPCLSDFDRAPIEAELDRLKRFQSNCIVEIIEVISAPTAVFLVMELMDHSVSDFQSSFRRILHTDRLHAILEISISLHTHLKDLHQQGLVYGQLKLSNVLFTKSLKVKLGDTMSGCECRCGVIAGISELDSLRYQPPEHFTSSSPAPSAASDTWALGMLLLEMITGRVQIGGNDCQTIRSNIASFDANEATGRLNPKTASLLRGFLDANPKERTALSKLPLNTLMLALSDSVLSVGRDVSTNEVNLELWETRQDLVNEQQQRKIEKLTEQATRNAETIEQMRREMDILKSDQGFITQMIPLLTCHNPEIVLSALELVYSITNDLPITQRLKVTEAQMIHLTLPSELYLIRIVFWSLLLGTPVLTSRVCESTDLTASVIRQTLYDNLIVPLEGFFRFICRNRYEIKDESESFFIAWVIGLLPYVAPYHAQTTQAVQRSSMSLAFCSGLSFFTHNFVQACFLNQLRDGIRSWSKAETDVRNRSKVILRRLNEEGLSDTLEQHIQTQGFDDNNDMDIFTAALSIHLLGGNIPYIDPDY